MSHARPTSAPADDNAFVPFPMPWSPGLDRPRSSKRPHHPETVAAVRMLYEGTTLTYAQIRTRTGVSSATICLWAQSCGWQRLPGASRPLSIPAHGIPTPRLKGRVLARRLRQICERWLNEIEQADDMPVHDLLWVLEMLKTAKLEEVTPLPRYSLGKRARKVAERLLEAVENDPNPDATTLSSALVMLSMAREEEAAARARRRHRELRRASPAEPELPPSS